MDPPPSFKAEIYYLVAKFLENGPCQNAAAALRNDLESNELVPPRYDWKGSSHQKTFKDMEDEFGQMPNEFLLQKCFDLCSKLNPGTSAVRSMLQKKNRSVARAKNTNFLQRSSSLHVFTNFLDMNLRIFCVKYYLQSHYREVSRWEIFMQQELTPVIVPQFNYVT